MAGSVGVDDLDSFALSSVGKAVEIAPGDLVQFLAVLDPDDFLEGKPARQQKRPSFAGAVIDERKIPIPNGNAFQRLNEGGRINGLVTNAVSPVPADHSPSPGADDAGGLNAVFTIEVGVGS